MNESSAMSQHKPHREKDSKPTTKKNRDNGVSSRQISGDNKNIDVKYTKVLADGEGSKKKTSTTHQETMTDHTGDVLAASR